jgi:DNA adenine methylase
MTDDDHRVLAEAARQLEGCVIISGYPCPLYDKELYPDWQRHERKHLADGARARTEVVWLNPACSTALREQHHQHPLFAVEARG